MAAVELKSQPDGLCQKKDDEQIQQGRPILHGPLSLLFTHFGRIAEFVAMPQHVNHTAEQDCEHVDEDKPDVAKIERMFRGLEVKERGKPSDEGDERHQAELLSGVHLGSSPKG
jgi:hypothetical protein